MSQEQIKDRVREQFGMTSAAYAVSATHRSGSDLDRLVELAECNPTIEALDIATGGGHTAREIARRVGHVVVSDITPQMLDTARSVMQSAGVHNVSYRIADAEALPFGNETFDLVTCRIAPHHFPDCQRFVQEVSRVLRPGGLFMLIDSTAPEDDSLDQMLNEFEWKRDSSHVRTHKRSQWEAMLAGASLSVEACEEFPKRHDFADWTTRSGMSSDERDELERWLLSAGSAFHETFGLEVESGSVIGFTDHKTLYKCRKT